ncbi:MAG TPA: QueT transporter family protein [archaeon]|nr:QueT transporter family protein [archaeon]
MKIKSPIQIALTAVFAALYAVGVVFLAPISFQIFQVRVADALLPLAMVFGWPAILGLSLGAFVANVFGGLGPVDMIGGAIANFLATLLAWNIVNRKGKRWMPVGVSVEILVVTLVVGTYLSYLLAIPLTLSWLGILLGSLAAIGILGSILLYTLSRRNIAALLESHGLRESKP